MARTHDHATHYNYKWRGIVGDGGSFYVPIMSAHPSVGAQWVPKPRLGAA